MSEHKGAQPKPQPQQINIQLPADLKPIYANFAVISHSPSEVFIDFAQLMPNTPRTRVEARIVMTPLNAKYLLRALSENLSKYEERFGEIKMPPPGIAPDRPVSFDQWIRGS